jgi:SAM-dependent methyltransferase
MAHRPWNESYASGDLPWDTGQPEPLLVEFVMSNGVKPCSTLEIGAGTGTNAIWLAERGFEVLGADISPIAVERAHARMGQRDLRCRFVALDFLTAPVPDGPFQFVFDRGCFHVFDDAEERQQFAARVAAVLAPGGLWLSLVGSTEGPPRDGGPPRRSAVEVAVAIEPALEIVDLRSVDFHGGQVTAWFCLSRQRTAPAQKSTRS